VKKENKPVWLQQMLGMKTTQYQSTYRHIKPVARMDAEGVEI
jgi:hypothetical protein